MNAPQHLDAAGIRQRIPHQGRMALLNALSGWSDTHIDCRVTNHADPAHPLRSAGGLLAPSAIEYAAQAMALHASLRAAAGATPRGGFLASARSVVMHVPRLDDAAGPLAVRAERLAGDERQAMYRFTMHDAAGLPLVEGRCTVVLDGVPSNREPAPHP
ncbi:MAG: hydroxymyristoyl-ACP dehydratase [Pseudomonadota bacterium]|nr:hydroxymyristoyl-ACP dehydratase [Pseudomonadota bacterium]